MGPARRVGALAIALTSPTARRASPNGPHRAVSSELIANSIEVSLHRPALHRTHGNSEATRSPSHPTLLYELFPTP